MFHFLCVISVAVFISGYLSPQIGLFGRGLRVGLPAACAALLFAIMAEPGAMLRALRRLRAPLCLGILFIAQAALRLRTLDVDAHWAVFVTDTFLVLVSVCMVFAVAEFGEPWLRRLAYLVFFVWMLSLSLGIPTLLLRPGAARMTMYKGLSGYGAMHEYYAAGVGAYGHYTGLAVAFLPLAAWALRRPPFWRWICIPCLVGGVVAVLLSTFTMAVVLLIASLLGALAYWVFQKKGQAIPRLILAVVAVIVIPGFVAGMISNSRQFSFVYDKTVNLWERTISVGLAQGDTTGRGGWFLMEMRDLMSNPLIGAYNGISDNVGHGHSSLSNTLLIHGIPGALLWFTALFLLWKASIGMASTKLVRLVLGLAWTILFCSGVLNPTWNRAGVIAPLVLFSMALAMTPGTVGATRPIEQPLSEGGPHPVLN